MLRHGVAAVVVRLVVRDGRTAECGTVQQHEVAVAHAGVEADVLARMPLPAVGDLRVQERDRLLLLGLADMPAGKVLQRAVGRHRDEVQAEDDVVGTHRDDLARGLQRTAPAQFRRQVAPQDAHVRHIARRREAVR